MNLRERIALIPGSDGWWHTADEQVFRAIARQLVVDYGLTEDQAIDILEAAFYAVKGEYEG